MSGEAGERRPVLRSTASAADGRAVERLPPLFWWLWSGWLLSALASFVLPFLAFFLAARGLPPSQVGLVVSAFGAGGLLAGPYAGVLADRVGRSFAACSAVAVGYAVMARGGSAVRVGP